jgi:hypothetical protein
MSDMNVVNAGITKHGQKVREEGQAEVFAISVNELENVSARARLAFSWSIVPAAMANADTVLLLQNDSDSLVLHIEKVIIETDTLSLCQIHLTNRAALTPAAGTAVTGVCLNQTAPRVAPAIAFADEQNNVQGNIIWQHELAADSGETIEWHGAILLAKGQSIAVDLTLAGLASCTILGFFAIPDEERI